ncbi:hypothetical protein TNCV_5034351 [Trichonephila clavipes]|nr:hypothetical protein TNCV_5034351 [Trichonephila clavipes]
MTHTSSMQEQRFALTDHASWENSSLSEHVQLHSSGKISNQHHVSCETSKINPENILNIVEVRLMEMVLCLVHVCLNDTRGSQGEGNPDAEDCGFVDDAIVTPVQEESDPVDNETDEDEGNNNNESSKGPSNADAFSALKTAMERYEQQSAVLLKRVRDLAAKKTKVYNGTEKNK